MRLYNHHIPQRALGHIAPVQALQDWQEKRPELFKNKVYNLTGLDTYLRAGGCFIAVGALHLPGEDGLLARLGRAGLRVRAVD
ncbi:MAG: TraB/GumN family protein [Chromatiaceae bacterium]|nr:TraB/GumN family protein [Chromatiaceae bacterium]